MSKGQEGRGQEKNGKGEKKVPVCDRLEVRGFCASWNRYCAGNGKGLFTGFMIEFSFSYGTGGYGIACNGAVPYRTGALH